MSQATSTPPLAQLNGKNGAQSEPIAVVGLGCWYPGARGPVQLWENILGRRREFRRMPDQRLPLAEYYDSDRRAPDKTYGRRAAVIDGFQFDWAGRRYPERTFQGTDIAHWLALEVAIAALEDAGLDRETAPRDQSAVIVGNTLTGEQTRANTMRLRWPYVRRALTEAARIRKLSDSDQRALLATMEELYKSVFPPVTDDTLAGGLANTIAGRICNYFDFHGGGYNVDGACSSSLLAICTAASQLESRDANLVVAGGVDISLDTFELIGFAKTGALTPDEMRVYDRRANGFIPGEGCGFVVMKRLADARADGDKVYAVVRGWGISSDGRGGITRPSKEGQELAIRRAYQRAGYSPRTLDFVEGHGTGTPVGDKTELEALAMAMDEAEGGLARCCGVTSFKSISGHTKAAAGVAAFIKAVMAVNRRIIPPTAGCVEPSEVFQTTARSLYPVRFGAVGDPSRDLRAGVSAMGFGGINTHVAIESADAPLASLAPEEDERKLLASHQESEVFALAAASPEELAEQAEALIEPAAKISQGEMVDLAKHLSQTLTKTAMVRAAIVARSPEELSDALQKAANALRQGHAAAGEVWTDEARGVWIGNAAKKNRLGFLFPGQGSQQLSMGRTLIERFGWARELAARADQWTAEVGDEPLTSLIYRPLQQAQDEEELRRWKDALAQTQTAQPAICLASLLYARHLANLGLVPQAVGGHSLGELTAFHAAGAMDTQTLFKIAAVRGRAMTSNSQRPGAMAALACPRSDAEELLGRMRGYVVVANINSPRQSVISGEEGAVAEVVQRASEAGISARRLSVSNAFHSDLVHAAVVRLASCDFIPRRLPRLKARVISGMDGREVDPKTDLRAYLSQQVSARVDFVSLVQRMSEACDLLIEVGPGRVLSHLAGQTLSDGGRLCLPVASQPDSDGDLNRVVAAAFAHGADVQWSPLYKGRLVRPFVPAEQRRFIENPCERPFPEFESAAPARRENEPSLRQPAFESNGAARTRRPATVAPRATAAPSPNGNGSPREKDSIEESLLDLVAQQTGYPAGAIPLSSRLLDDLNLDSIKAAEFVAEAAARAGMAGQLDPTRFANASLAELRDAIERSLEESATTGQSGAQASTPPALSPEAKEAARADAEAEAPAEVRPSPNGSAATGSTKPVRAGESVDDMLLSLIEAQTGYPAASVPLSSRLLDDLNLDSIKAAEFVAEAAARCGSADQLDPTRFANATLAEIATALRELQDAPASEAPSAPAESAKPAEPAEAAQPVEEPRNWVRNFAIRYTPQERSEEGFDGSQASVRIVCEPAEREVAEMLSRQVRDAGGAAEILGFDAVDQQWDVDASHWIAVLPRRVHSAGDDRAQLARSVQRLRSVASPLAHGGGGVSVTYVQFCGLCAPGASQAENAPSSSAAGFARSLHLERKDLQVRVVDFCPDVRPESVAAIVPGEMSGPAPFAMASYDHRLTRHVPEAVLQQPARYAPRSHDWSAEDVALVTGGAKGITAECALALGQATGVQLALVGRSPAPASDAADDEIARTLRRCKQAGVVARYYCCDITDARAVNDTIDVISRELGAITAVVHGAGANRPRPIQHTTSEAAVEEIAPKLLGGRNLCAALAEAPPRMFVAFTSIIGVTGMPGNAWYAFSNESLDQMVREFGRRSGADTLSIAYSVWDEVGMGARLGSVEKLAQMGIGAIPVREGVERFLRLFERDPQEHQVVVTARLGGLDTWRPRPLPASHGLRFIEEILDVEPEVELRARTRLTLDRDLYVRDHNYNGSYLFPTVFGLEAMAEAAWLLCLTRREEIVRIEDVTLERPIVVHPENGVEIEIAARAMEETEQGERRVRVGIRTQRTGFAHDHFAATLVLGDAAAGPRQPVEIPERLDIAPREDLYGDLLFQGPLFQRMEAIHTLEDRRCLLSAQQRPAAEVAGCSFAGGENNEMALGDAYFRDVLLQSIQLTIPQDICLPVGIGRMERWPAPQPDDGWRVVHVVLQRREGRHWVGEITATDRQGNVVERLTDYRVRILHERPDSPTAAELAQPADRDEARVQTLLTRVFADLGLETPAVALDCSPNLQRLPQFQRREKERPVVARALRAASGGVASDQLEFEVLSDRSGKPSLSGAAADGFAVSLSHDDRYLLCSVGRGAQGCDIEPITSRSREAWTRILGAARSELIDVLLRQGDDLDQAAMRLWTALEAVRKTDLQADPVFTVKRRAGDAVLLEAPGADGPQLVVTVPVKLTRRPHRMIAVSVSRPPAPAGAPLEVAAATLSHANVEDS